MNATMNKTTNTFQRIAINTGGGDAPGLNAVHPASPLNMNLCSNGWQTIGEFLLKKSKQIADNFSALLAAPR
jgi:hypothetical protein